MASTAAMIKAQDEADAAAWQTIKNDPVDPCGFFQDCALHPEHPGHYFLTYCVICPEDTGNGKVSAAAREAAAAALMADCPDVPF
jgi:hypothetical protein